MKNADIEDLTLFVDHVYSGCTQWECKPNEKIIEQYNKMFESRISGGATEKLPGWEKPWRKNFSVVLRHGRTCPKMRGTVLWTSEQKRRATYKVSSPCWDDHQMKKEELENTGELSEICSHIVLKCLYFARLGRPDILWSVNKLAFSEDEHL